MRELARVYLSSNGKEFLIYDGNDNLVSVEAVTETVDFEQFGIQVYEGMWQTLNQGE